MLESWFHLTIRKNIVALAGMVLFLLPLIHVRRYRDIISGSYTLRIC
jgi:hypothetical protein